MGNSRSAIRGDRWRQKDEREFRKDERASAGSVTVSNDNDCDVQVKRMSAAIVSIKERLCRRTVDIGREMTRFERNVI